MPRIDRKNMLIPLPKNGGIFTLMDGLFQVLFRAEPEMTNRILNTLNEEDMEFLLSDFENFSNKKKLIKWINSKV